MQSVLNLDKRTKSTSIELEQIAWVWERESQIKFDGRIFKPVGAITSIKMYVDVTKI